jgi:hypothetical protein
LRFRITKIRENKKHDKKEELKTRTKKFAIDTFTFLNEIEKNKAVDVISYQLFKSSS